MAGPGGFPSSCGENHPDPKSGQDLDPDKLGCTMSCQRDEADTTFSRAFSGLRAKYTKLAGKMSL